MMEPTANFASRETRGGASGPTNQVKCPRCGRVRLETPPGTRVLPTLGMARKMAGVAGECDCGKAPHERPGARHVPGDPSGPGTVTDPNVRDE